MQSNNAYLIGAMLDPLVAEFMSPAYCEARLEVEIRMDELRHNCPSRAGFVCVADPRVKGGHYYRKHVEGEGVNALPPSRLEKALNRHEDRSQNGGLSTLGKVAIASGLAVGGLAGIGAIANSGRSAVAGEEVKSTNTAATPTTTKATTTPSATYSAARQQALLSPRFRRMGSKEETVNNGVITVPPMDSPQAARRKRGQPQYVQSTTPTVTPTGGYVHPSPIPPWSPSLIPTNNNAKSKGFQEALAKVGMAPIGTAQSPSLIPVTSVTPSTETVTSNPEPTQPKTRVISAKPTIISNPKAATQRAEEEIKSGYQTNAIADVAGTYGYKSLTGIKEMLSTKGVISKGSKGNDELSSMIDNHMLVGHGLLVQTEAKNGRQRGFGKDNIGMARIPMYTTVETLTQEATAISSGVGTLAQRIPKARKLAEAITEKLNDPELNDEQRVHLSSYRDNLTIGIGINEAKLARSQTLKIPSRVPYTPTPDDGSHPLGPPAKSTESRPISALTKQLSTMPASKLAAKIEKEANIGDNAPFWYALKRTPVQEKPTVSQAIKGAYKQMTDPVGKEFIKDFHDFHLIVGSTDIPPMRRSKNNSQKSPEPSTAQVNTVSKPKPSVAEVKPATKPDSGILKVTNPDGKEQTVPIEKSTATKPTKDPSEISSQKASDALERVEAAKNRIKAVTDNILEHVLKGDAHDYLHLLDNQPKTIATFNKHSTQEQKDIVTNAIAKLNSSIKHPEANMFYEDMHSRLTGKKKLPKIEQASPSTPNPSARAERDAPSTPNPPVKKQRKSKADREVKKTIKDSFIDRDIYSLARERAKQQFLRRVAA